MVHCARRIITKPPFQKGNWIEGYPLIHEPTILYGTAVADGLTPAERESDRAIEARLSKGKLSVMDFEEGKTSPFYRKSDLPLRRFIERLLAAGAPRVHVDPLGQPRGRAPLSVCRPKLYVEFPTAPEQRDACFAVVGEFQTADPKAVVTPALPTRARFLEIEVPR